MQKVKVFDESAESYDKWFDENTGLYVQELEALKKAIPSNRKGVEIGAGTGRFGSRLGIATGIEPAQKMAEIAAERGMEIIPGVAENLPLEDESYDYTLMVTVDCFLQDVSKAFSEAFRVLKKGGCFVLGMIDKGSPLGEKYQEIKNDDPYYKHANFHDVKELTDRLEAVGFKNPKHWQTLFGDQRDPDILKGYGKGGFVVIKIYKY